MITGEICYNMFLISGFSEKFTEILTFMIVSLSIKNFVLVKEVSLAFAPGMNVITGMTGGGKSLILKALDFLLGARPSPDMVYPGETFTEISALFTVSSELRKQIDAITGIAIEEEDDLVLRRRYRADKSNVCFINGSSALVSDLKKVGDLLVDYLAQNHQLQLQKQSFQLSLFDAYADAQNLLDTYSSLYKVLIEKEALLEEILNGEKDVSDRLEFLEHTYTELKVLDPRHGEDEELKQEISVYDNISSIISSSSLKLFTV